MNRTRRKQAKMLRRQLLARAIFSPSTYIWWRNQRFDPTSDPYSGLTQERLDAAMKAAWDNCAQNPPSDLTYRTTHPNEELSPKQDAADVPRSITFKGDKNPYHRDPNRPREFLID